MTIIGVVACLKALLDQFSSPRKACGVYYGTSEHQIATRIRMLCPAIRLIFYMKCLAALGLYGLVLSIREFSNRHFVRSRAQHGAPPIPPSARHADWFNML